MQIHFILTQDIESPSGLGRYWPMAKTLVKLGHRVTISALHGDYSKLKTKNENIHGVQINYVSQMHVLKQGNTKKYYSPIQLFKISILATFRLLKSVVSTPADIIHIGKPHPMNSIASFVGRSKNKSIIFLDIDDAESGIGHFQNGWQRKVILFFERWVPSKVDFITTNTFFNKNRLIHMGLSESKIAYIPNGIDLDHFSSPETAKVQLLKNELHLNNKKIVAYIGTLGIQSHPIHLLLEAFKIVRSKNSETRLLLVGGGEDFLSLKHLVCELDIQDSVIFTGRVNPKDVPLYYALSDVTVDPVYDDLAARGRCPIKLFESWVAGVPVVTSDVGDRKDLLGVPLAGLLAPPGDANALASSILQIIENSKLAGELSDLGRKQTKIYNWNRLGKELEIVYQRVFQEQKQNNDN